MSMATAVADDDFGDGPIPSPEQFGEGRGATLLNESKGVQAAKYRLLSNVSPCDKSPEPYLAVPQNFIDFKLNAWSEESESEFHYTT